MCDLYGVKIQKKMQPVKQFKCLLSTYLSLSFNQAFSNNSDYYNQLYSSKK